MNVIEKEALDYSQAYSIDYNECLMRVLLCTAVHEFGHSFGLDDRSTGALPNSIMNKGLPNGLFSDSWLDAVKPQLVDFIAAIREATLYSQIN